MMRKGFAWRALVALGIAVASPALAQLQLCQQNCSRLEIGQAEGSPGGIVTIPVSFTQAPDNGSERRGNDDIAAIAFTIGIPGSVDGATPLHFDCTDANSDGRPDALSVNATVDANFRVVIENADCVNRNRCLCPGTNQTRDNFINVVVYGPKNLPEQGPVDIPEIPSGPLMTIALRIAAGTAAPSTIPLHVYSELDNPIAIPKPQFGANFSQGDQSAVDETADRGAGRAKMIIVDGGVSVRPGGVRCAGDCNQDGQVTVDELIRGVNIALGNADLSQCPTFDITADGRVTINELITAVNNALNGCPS